MLIGGIIVLALAGAALLVARSQRAKARTATATETLSCADIDMLARGVAGEVGGGVFRQRCEIVGQAVAGEGGLIKAPHSGVDAVWHRSTVQHRYWEMEERVVDGQTQRNRVEREDQVSDISSAAPFAVSDGSGQVVVSPDGADVDSPEPVVDRFEPYVDSAPAPSGLMGVFSSVLRSGAHSGTLGFRYEEWILRPGARVYVHGQVTDASGQVAFAKPDAGRYIISTRSEAQIVGAAERNGRIAAVVAGVLGVAGIALVIAGALA